jgi:chromosome partitioning protein
VLDCSPSLSLMNQNALVVADAVLCPVACDYLSLLGVKQVVRTIKQINRLLGHPLNLLGVLPTLYDARARLCKESLETLRETFRDACLEPVHFAIKAKEAPSQGKTLFEYAPTSPTALDYARLVERVLGQETTTLARGTA